MSLVIYNTLSKKKEEFKSIEPNKVKLYLCGPTVYGLLHIGNFRGPIFFNFARNWLEKSGYEVNFTYNYTDIDDKIIKKANEEGVDSLVISERYIEEFKTDFKRLGLREHTNNPKVTDYVKEIVEYVETIVKNNHAYVVDNEVFFDISSLESYGELSGKKIDELSAGERVEVDNRKRNPGDFVLWKPAKEKEPSWDSPWGKGRPGWHIECSAMIKSILGKTIDIHGGGIDLIFPHHENEIAQGVGCNSCKYVNYWMHNNFINMKGEKMSKSLGNIIPGRVFMDEYHPEVLKFLILSTHYRSILNVSDEKIEQTFSGLLRVYRAIKSADFVLENFENNNEGKPNKKLSSLLADLDNKIEKSINDDFGTGELFAAIYDAVRTFNALNLERKKKDINSYPTAKLFKEWISGYGEMLALFNENPESFLLEVNELFLKQKNIDKNEVLKLLDGRKSAREAKDWEKADQFRDQLHNMGIDFSETGDSVEWFVKV